MAKQSSTWLRGFVLTTASLASFDEIFSPIVVVLTHPVRPGVTAISIQVRTSKTFPSSGKGLTALTGRSQQETDMALGDVLARLSVELSLNSAAFEAGTKRAARTSAALGDRMERLGDRVGTVTKSIIGVGAAIAGSQIVGKLADMAKAGLEHASSLGEQATQLGVSTSALQRYRYMATQVGIEQTEMDKGLSKLSLSLGKLALGTDKQQAALAKYGFSTKEAANLSKLTAEQALPVLADKYRALSSDTEKAAFVAEFFGSKLGSKFKTLLEGGSEGVNKLAEAYKKLGIEISPEQIAAADDAMDKAAQSQLVLQSKLAQIAASNAENITRGTLAWEEFKVQAVGAFVSALPHLQAFSDKMGGLDASIRSFGKASGFHAFIDETGRKFTANVGSVVSFLKSVEDTSRGVGSSVRSMVSTIQAEMGPRLRAVMDAARTKFADVKAAAFDMWDKVTRRSYVPDMVDDIAAEMRRLDAEMVKPAGKAADKVAERFKKLQGELKSMMDRLFPEEAAFNRFQDDRAKIAEGVAKKAIPQATADALNYGLSREGTDEPTFLADFLSGADAPLANMKKVRSELAKLTGQVDDTADKSESASVRIEKTFKDMAEATLSAFSNLASSIKSGGFMGILQSVIGLGLQLGGVGLFGKSLAGRINAPEHRALGGSVSAGRPYLVGERGPELVVPRSNGHVTPNSRLGGRGGNTYYLSGNLLTPEFWAQIQAGDARAAVGGANLGMRRNARARKWALA